MIEAKPGRLIVACQPSSPSSPLNSPDHIVAMAIAAEEAGASALLVDTPHHVISVKAAASLPVIGQWRRFRPDGCWAATPDWESAAALAAAGADLILLDATAEGYPDRAALAQLVEAIQQNLNLPVIAAVRRMAEAEHSVSSGAQAVAALSPVPEGQGEAPAPDLGLVGELAERLVVPVLAYGGYWEPGQARAALDAGAAFVIVGAAITAPDLQAARFVAHMADRGYSRSQRGN